MIERTLAFEHRILIGPKIRQQMLQKVIRRPLRIRALCRKGKRLKITEIIREFSPDQIKNLARDRIRRNRERLWHKQITLRRFAIVVVIIPLAPRRLPVRLHQ